MHNRFAFVGGESGSWRVVSARPVRGAPLSSVARLEVVDADDFAAIRQPTWVLHGQKSNLRYATRSEVTQLSRLQQPLGRAGACLAALIPIKKTAAWWALAQDERRFIFEDQSRHTAVGLEYLPAIARQLYHSRDLGQSFDFLTWFEYAPEYAEAFEALVQRLRSTMEWSFVEREFDIRLVRES